MPDSQDVETLKRRGRRRLVGAIALVLLAVIILPMVFDSEPRQAPPVSVRIPSEEDSGFRPKVVPKVPPPAVTPDAAAKPDVKPATKADPKPEPKPEPKPKPEAAPDTKASPKPAPATDVKPKVAASVPAVEAERRRAEAALAGASQFVVPVAALATEDKLRHLTELLAAEKMPYFTEPIATAKGTVTRVRAGPFASREAAEQALQKLKNLGLKPGAIVTR